MENNIDYKFEENVTFDEMDKDYLFRGWLHQTQPVQIRNYGFEEVDREEAFFAMEEELFDILFER